MTWQETVALMGAWAAERKTACATQPAITGWAPSAAFFTLWVDTTFLFRAGAECTSWPRWIAAPSMPPEVSSTQAAPATTARPHFNGVGQKWYYIWDSRDSINAWVIADSVLATWDPVAC